MVEETKSGAEAAAYTIDLHKFLVKDLIVLFEWFKTGNNLEAVLPVLQKALVGDTKIEDLPVTAINEIIEAIGGTMRRTSGN